MEGKRRGAGTVKEGSWNGGELDGKGAGREGS